MFRRGGRRVEEPIANGGRADTYKLGQSFLREPISPYSLSIETATVRLE